MIFFVGAGPGAEDLITLRGAELLRRASMVIYAGSLVNPGLLKLCPPDCEILDSASMDLEQIAGALIRGSREGGTVVRLHTGDPSIYGAIREQMDLLDQQGVEYQVVPGVSSFAAAAAALNAEFTRPGVSQTVILSRRGGRTPVPAKEDLPLLAGHRASMVLFLSSGMLAETASDLMAGGYSPDTPAALVYKASWPDQKVLRTTLGKLAEDGEAAGISKTALILVGDFLDPSPVEPSKLYDAGFSHGFRQTRHPQSEPGQ